MTWVTEADVLAVTGTPVSAEQVARGQGVIELYAGVTVDVEDLTTRDLRLLKAAVSYQTVWMAGQIDVLTRTDVKSLDQDGVKVVPADMDSLILSPLAKRALANVSWLRRVGTTRAVLDRGCRYRTFEEYAAAWLRDDTRDQWRPL